DPAALALVDRFLDRAVPGALGRFPAQRHAGAAVLVVRLDDEAIAVLADVRDQIDVAAVAADGPLADHRRPREVPADERALAGVERGGAPLVAEPGEERLFVRDLAAQRVRDADGPPLVRLDQRAALVGAGDDVVDEDATIDEIDGPAARRQHAA